MFQDMKGVYGGAVYIQSNAASTKLQNVSFEDIVSGYQGGAIFLESSPNVEVVGSTFSNCAVAYASTDSTGGAIHAVGSAGLSIVDTSFSECRTEGGYGGAVYLGADTNGVSITNSSFEDNIGSEGTTAEVSCFRSECPYISYVDRIDGIPTSMGCISISRVL